MDTKLLTIYLCMYLFVCFLFILLCWHPTLLNIYYLYYTGMTLLSTACSSVLYNELYDQIIYLVKTCSADCSLHDTDGNTPVHINIHHPLQAFMEYFAGRRSCNVSYIILLVDITCCDKFIILICILISQWYQMITLPITKRYDVIII